MISETHKGFKAISAASAQHWREWLNLNHKSGDSIWLIIFKKDSGVNSVTYQQAVDEALCFGWVDSKPNKRDETSYYQFFSPRNPRSNWSRVNKNKVARLIASGKMAPPGLTMVATAKENGTWDALNEVDALLIPEDLQAAFDQYPDAVAEWNAFPKSVRRGILEWIFNAKRPETRARRIAETASKTACGERANQYRR